ncbi:hypothetical protein niasHT_013698 [Heterodera trifolii]|uniref:Uncharacterized protein n=1 Tax=Heterodera trifolii TaxID=157864 RepID=A0ABD2LCN9_9BILA
MASSPYKHHLHQQHHCSSFLEQNGDMAQPKKANGTIMNGGRHGRLTASTVLGHQEYMGVGQQQNQNICSSGDVGGSVAMPMSTFNSTDSAIVGNNCTMAQRHCFGVADADHGTTAYRLGIEKGHNNNQRHNCQPSQKLKQEQKQRWTHQNHHQQLPNQYQQEKEQFVDHNPYNNRHHHYHNNNNNNNNESIGSWKCRENEAVAGEQRQPQHGEQHNVEVVVVQQETDMAAMNNMHMKGNHGDETPPAMPDRIGIERVLALSNGRICSGTNASEEVYEMKETHLLKNAQHPSGSQSAMSILMSMAPTSSSSTQQYNHNQQQLQMMSYTRGEETGAGERGPLLPNDGDDEAGIGMAGAGDEEIIKLAKIDKFDFIFKII